MGSGVEQTRTRAVNPSLPNPLRLPPKPTRLAEAPSQSPRARSASELVAWLSGSWCIAMAPRRASAPAKKKQRRGSARAAPADAQGLAALPPDVMQIVASKVVGLDKFNR